MAPVPCASMIGSADRVVRKALVRLNSSCAAHSSSLSSTGPSGSGAAYVVDEHVEPAPARGHGRDYPRDLSAIGNVGGLHDTGAALARDDLPRGFRRCRIAIQRDDLRPFAGEQHRGGAAVAPAWADRACAP